MSLKFAEDVLALEVAPDHKNFPRIMQLKQSVSASILTATARVRDGLLRPSGGDELADLLKELNRSEGVVTAEDVLN